MNLGNVALWFAPKRRIARHDLFRIGGVDNATKMALSEREALRINLEGRELEKAGRVDEAIALYESGVARGTDTPATYKRLRILYRRLKRPEDVDRIRRLMIERWGHSW